MDEIRIGYFLEDIAQERFVKALVNRVAEKMGLHVASLRHEVRNATGGRGNALDELQRFLRDVRRESERPFDVLVVAIDGDCCSYRERRDQIRAIVEQSGYPGSVICAVPDPYIERWYLADPGALHKVFGVHRIGKVPTYKCEPGCYKQALGDAIRRAGVVAPLGGSEYGPGIAKVLDLYVVGKENAGFKHFVDDLREALAASVRGQEK